MPDFATDTLALWRRVTREEGVALYMHYSGVFDIKYCDAHPEETVIKADGSYERGATRTDGAYVDELMIPQLSELAEKYGVDGVWVDGDCWKACADFRPESLKKFENETGIDLGGKIPATPDAPYYQEYRDYARELFRRYLRHYVDTLHEKHPHLQITSNWAFSDHMPEKISANVDFLSGDLKPENSFNSARYGARVLAQQNHPWDLMSWNFRRATLGHEAVLTKHVTQIKQEAAAVISLGGAYQNYVRQHLDGSPNMTDVANLAELFDFLRARKDYCFRATPIHQAALLLSTHDRHLEADNLFSCTGFERAMGASVLLCDIGQSLEIICEHTLAENRDAYKAIVVPEIYRELAPETVTSLLDYAKVGGALVLMGRKTCALFAAAGAPFSVTPCDEYFAAGEKAYDYGGDVGHADTASKNHKPYYFTTDGHRFGVAFAPAEITAQAGVDKAFLSVVCEGAGKPLATTMPYGAGTVSAIGFDVGSQYVGGAQYMHRTLMSAVMDGLYEPLVKIESVTGRLEVTALCKDGRIMLQLVNANGTHADLATATDDQLPPVLDITLSISLDKKPEKLLLQPDGKPLSFDYADGKAVVQIGRIDVHNVIEIVK